MKPAGVLIPVVERLGALSLLLTERSAELKHHAGQISFPGGRMEASDPSIEHTALRETHEEVGIAPTAVSVIGYLEPMVTITGYAVTPVIGLLQADIELRLDRNEVAQAFEVPLPFLLDRQNQRASVREVKGRRLPIIEYHYEGHRIWGATAHMIFEFRKMLLKQ